MSNSTKTIVTLLSEAQGHLGQGGGYRGMLTTVHHRGGGYRRGRCGRGEGKACIPRLVLPLLLIQQQQ